MYRIPILLLLGLLSFFRTSVVVAAPQVNPPLSEIRQRGNVTVEGKLVGIDNPTSTIRFRVDRTIRGEFKHGVTRVLVPQETLALFSSQVTYVLVLVVLAPDPKSKAMTLVDVPTLFVAEGAAPAIYLATPEARELFDEKHALLEGTPAYKSHLLAQLKNPDPQLVELFCAELLLRAEIRTDLSAAESSAVLDLVKNDMLRPPTRARILLAASNQFFDVAKPEVDLQSISVLRHLPSNVALSGFDNSTELLLAALRHFSNKIELAGTLPPDVLTKYLRSSHPAIVEASVLLLQRVAPNEVDHLVAQALDYTLLNRDARSVLVEFQRRQEMTTGNESSK